MVIKTKWYADCADCGWFFGFGNAPVTASTKASVHAIRFKHTVNLLNGPELVTTYRSGGKLDTTGQESE